MADGSLFDHKIAYQQPRYTLGQEEDETPEPELSEPLYHFVLFLYRFHQLAMIS